MERYPNFTILTQEKRVENLYFYSIISKSLPGEFGGFCSRKKYTVAATRVRNKVKIIICNRLRIIIVNVDYFEINRLNLDFSKSLSIILMPDKCVGQHANSPIQPIPARA